MAGAVSVFATKRRPKNMRRSRRQTPSLEHREMIDGEPMEHGLDVRRDRLSGIADRLRRLADPQASSREHER